MVYSQASRKFLVYETKLRGDNSYGPGAFTDSETELFFSKCMTTADATTFLAMIHER